MHVLISADDPSISSDRDRQWCKSQWFRKRYEDRGKLWDVKLRYPKHVRSKDKSERQQGLYERPHIDVVFNN